MREREREREEKRRERSNTWRGLPSFSSWRLNPVAIRVILTCMKYQNI